MKKILSGFFAMMVACAMFFAGCEKALPTVEQMKTTATCIGTAAGMAANLTKIEAADKAVLKDIMNKVEKCVPVTNQTFTAAWTPIATEHTEALVKTGKLTSEKSVLLLSAFSTACRGIDYIFDVRYPAARQYNDLIAAAVTGFTSGFNGVLAVDADKLAAPPRDYDKEALEFLTKSV